MSAIRALGAHLRDQYEQKCARRGLAYPWWIALIGGGGQVVCILAAAVQRDLLVPPELPALALALAVAPHLAQYYVRSWVPWWVDTVLVLGAVAWLMSVPFEGTGPANLAPAAAVFLAGSVTATAGVRAGAATTGTSIVVVLVADRLGDRDPDIDLYVIEILGGLMVGFMLLWQMRALEAERRERERERERATLAERQRIAREIHDLVAHSLSVTMLHVTGAKQALVEDHDVDDAVAALEDAEQVGRQAMAEIRRTVSVLATDSVATHRSASPGGEGRAHPLPCAEDIGALVAQVRDAGLPVDYRSRGDLTRLSPAVGLGLYRILQESLTNVAKHAPGATARVRVDVGAERAALSVRNRRADGAVATDGSGTSGMASRAEQIGGTLRVGPDQSDPGQWVVDLAVPVEDFRTAVSEALT